MMLAFDLSYALSAKISSDQAKRFAWSYAVYIKVNRELVK